MPWNALRQREYPALVHDPLRRSEFSLHTNHRRQGYSLLGDKDQLQNFAGGSAIVTGHMDGDKIEVSSISPVIKLAEAK
jgi:hypothetical protein